MAGRDFGAEAIERRTAHDRASQRTPLGVGSEWSSAARSRSSSMPNRLQAFDDGADRVDRVDDRQAGIEAFGARMRR
jgi:hypothetical protein